MQLLDKLEDEAQHKILQITPCVGRSPLSHESQTQILSTEGPGFSVFYPHLYELKNRRLFDLDTWDFSVQYHSWRTMYEVNTEVYLALQVETSKIPCSSRGQVLANYQTREQLQKRKSVCFAELVWHNYTKIRLSSAFANFLPSSVHRL